MAEVDAWRALASELAAGRPCALLTVAERRGSGPGRVGAVFAVGADGPLAGTIGGGPGEDALAASTAAALRAGGPWGPHLVGQVHRRGAAEASGLVCGGEHTVLVAPLGPPDAHGIAAIAAALASGRRAGWIVTPAGWRAAPAAGEAGHTGPPAGLVREPGGWRFAHASGPTHTVWLVGAGHVGRALARLLVGLDFRVGVVDERPGAAADAGAHEAVTLAYERLGEVVTPGPGVLVVVAAHSPERDAAALEALAGLRLGYLGVLASGARARTLLGARPRPPWLHVPAGLAIRSRSSEEVAVSVAAQLVGVRAGA